MNALPEELQAIRERDDPLERICRLCGYPLGKHVAPPYGHEIPLTGLGLLCPIDERASTEIAKAAYADEIIEHAPKVSDFLP